MATLEIEPLDPSLLVKTNNLAEITNPVFFNKFGQPTSDGLLSNEIFGITKNDRAESFAYIDLVEPFISPAFYKAWSRVDSKLNACVHQTDTFKINSEGKLEKDPNGSNGIKWLKDNYDKFKWKENESFAHNQDIEFLKKFKDKVFITKYPIIPAYYRDVSTTNDTRVDVGIINKFYNSLLLAVRALKDSKDYGLTLSGAIRGRIQESIVAIYSWFAEEPQLGKKFGILRRAGMAKTTDYSARLVMTAPKLNVENMEDLSIDADHASIPLASLCVNFFPFVIFHMRRFFENEFAGRSTITDTDGDVYQLDNYQLYYSEDQLKVQLDRFIHGYSNRFIMVEVPVKNSKHKIYMRLKGNLVRLEDTSNMEDRIEEVLKSSSIFERYLTWCDIIYQAVCRAVENKMVLVTRYPMDSYFNQVPFKPNVSSTIETETVIINGEIYRRYPKIRDEYIGKDTSNMFIDTMNLPNFYLKSMGGDYKRSRCSLQ